MGKLSPFRNFSGKSKALIEKLGGVLKKEKSSERKKNPAREELRVPGRLKGDL